MVSYAIRLDETWTTRSARITGRSASGIRHAQLEADGLGRWRVDGELASHLDDCHRTEAVARARELSLIP